MLHQLHFDELDCPYGDEPFEHDILFESSDKIRIKNLLDEIIEIKASMDDDTYGNDAEDAEDDYVNPMFEKYGDYGWDEKIDIAFKLAMKKLNYHYKLPTVKYHNCKIN